ncbi:hypothetical protein [Klebsiella michiganensis]
MMALKQKFIRAVGSSPFTPRWLKILCFHWCVREISTGFSRFMAGIDANKLTTEQRSEIEALIAKFNKAHSANRREAK